jgi:hypothetical protein
MIQLARGDEPDFSLAEGGPAQKGRHRSSITSPKPSSLGPGTAAPVTIASGRRDVHAMRPGLEVARLVDGGGAQLESP